MADRVGVLSKGALILVEDKAALMQKLGGKQLTLQLQTPLPAIPSALSHHGLTLAKGGTELIYHYEGAGEETASVDLLQELSAAGIGFSDLHTTQRSLEDIFVSLVAEPARRGVGEAS